MPLFTPLRRTVSRLEFTHYPASTLALGVSLLIASCAIGWADVTFRAKMGPVAYFSLLLLPIFAVGALCITLFPRWVSEVVLDIQERSVVIVRRQWLRALSVVCDPITERHSSDGITEVILRKEYRRSSGRHKSYLVFRHLLLVKDTGEEIFLLAKNYNQWIFGGADLGKEIADFLGVPFRSEVTGPIPWFSLDRWRKRKTVA